MAKLYTVDDLTERTTINRTGLIVKLWRITATTPSGTIFTEEITGPDFNEEKVKEILSAKAQLIESIRKS